VGWIVFSKNTSGRSMEEKSTFLHILQRRRQVEVAAHSSCAIAQVKRSPSPLGKEGGKCKAAWVRAEARKGEAVRPSSLY